MLEHYLLSFFRNFKNNLSHHILNLIGLSTGIAACSLIYLYCQDELSFDRFHKNHERIFKLVDTYTFSDVPVNSANISAPMGPALVDHIPQVEMCVRINKYTGLVRPENKEENEFEFNRILIVDSGFFQLFSYPLIKGDPINVLNKPNTVVLTESTSKKLFGSEEPIGQLIKTNLLGGQVMVVTGIMKDPSTNSHIAFDMLISHVSMINIITTLNHWLVYGTHTYLLLHPGVNPETLRPIFKELVLQNVGPDFAPKYNHHLVPIESIHLGMSRRGDLEPGGSRIVVYILLAVGFLILFLIASNFISLSMSIANNRIQECGIRKSIGSSKSQLIFQLMIESCLISLSATILAFGMLVSGITSFNFLSGKTFLINRLIESEIIGVTIGMGLMIGIISGLFPSIFLARLDPVYGLKKMMSHDNGNRIQLKKILVIAQFTIVIALLILIAIIRQQLDYFRNHDLGFNKSGAVVIPINNPILSKNRITFEDELKSIAGVSNVSTSSSLPSKSISFGPFRLAGGAFDDNAILNIVGVDDGYIPTLELQLLAGRAFDRSLATDSTSFIINEVALKSLGIVDAQDAIGQILEMHGPNKEVGALKRGPIIGVSKNFHYKSLKEEVEPVVLHMSKTGFGFFLIRLQSNQIALVLENIKNTWEKVVPDQTMIYSFLDDDLDKLYQSEKRLEQIFTLFNYLTVVIGCIGLFGLSSYVIIRKAKEISLRKVLGSTSHQIIYKFSLDFIKLILVAYILACPIAYYASKLWLQSFAYHDTIKPINFIMAGVVALFVTCGTTIYHVVIAASTNPINNLRSE